MQAQAQVVQIESAFARDVRAGLSRVGQKELPSIYLYDDVGSALFDVITLLPEYGLTRADMRVIQEHAGDILAHMPRNPLVAELGSGTGKKTRFFLEAAASRGPVRYYPIDISGSALARCEAELASPGAIQVTPIEKPYVSGLAEVASGRRSSEALLVLFLGSTIGNFESRAAREFLLQVRSLLRRGDALLLGTDLVKPVSQMLLAYDDPAGVTAAFNLNLLARINRELGGNFRLRQFRHEARWDPDACRIEMHLVSRRRQTVRIPGAAVTAEFQAGGSIWTEACHKFKRRGVAELARATGFDCAAQWMDAEWEFVESLFTVV